MARMGVVWSTANYELTYFDDSPDAGTPECICSYCGFMIGADEVPLRIFSNKENKEARLCMNCLEVFSKVSGLPIGILRGTF